MLISFVLVAALSAAEAPVDTPAETPVVTTRDCVTTYNLRSTAVLDDETILFQLRDGSVWKNTLDSSCPSLGFREAFSYVSRGSQLCDLDTIKVFEPYGNSGVTCGLGKFELQAGTMRELRAAAREKKRLARASAH